MLAPTVCSEPAGHRSRSLLSFFYPREKSSYPDKHFLRRTFDEKTHNVKADGKSFKKISWVIVQNTIDVKTS